MTDYPPIAVGDTPQHAALRAVLDLHPHLSGPSLPAGDECGACYDIHGNPEPWPCPTVRAITDHGGWR